VTIYFDTANNRLKKPQTRNKPDIIATDGLNSTFTQGSTTNTNGTVTVTWNAPSAGTYVISLKFNAQSVDGQKALTNPKTVGYSFSTPGVSGSTQMLNLVRK
jgi:hypothetical protein